MAADATQYLLPEGLDLEAALARLAARLQLAVGPVGAVDRTFFDTFDGRLHAAGLALVGGGGRLVAAGGAGYGELAAAAVAPGTPGSASAPATKGLFAGDLPEGVLRDLLAPKVEVRALLPIVRTRGSVRPLRVLNRDEKTVVRLQIEAPTAINGAAGGGGAAVPLRPRVRVIAVRGYDRAVARVRRTLVEDLGLEPSRVPLHDEAVLALGGRPGGTPAKLDLRLIGGAPAAAGAAVALGEILRTIELNLPGVVDDIDNEFLHDFRVAVRRTRSVQRRLATVFPAERLRWFRAEFRWLGQVTGPTRDLDVLLQDLVRFQREATAGRAAELAPLGDLLRGRREAEWERMVAALESQRARRLLGDWKAFLVELGGDGAAGPTLGEVVGRRIRTVYRQMRRAGAAIDEDSPAVELHDLRKQGKELRYLLEIFAGLFPSAAVKPTVRTLKALQETLGEFQDRCVQATTMRSLGAELATVAGGPAALIALGVVLERIEDESAAARADFSARFAIYAAPEQRALVRESFR
ncbi:MAG: CHAD domain-containing protein [Solirubrobacteraceae bacterium]